MTADNATAPEAGIAGLFAATVLSHGDRVAVVDGTQQLSYAELDARANALAVELQAHGIAPEVTVGIWGSRSLEHIVATLAILKAGGAYVPLDDGDPAERLRLIADDANLALIVDCRPTDDPSACSPAELFNRPVVVASSTPTTPAPRVAPACSAGPTSLAYVMYTSGSTGRPKGVAIENRSVVRLVRDTTYCRFGPDHTVLHFAPPAFDAATFEIWGALLNGGKLVIAPRHASFADLGHLIHQHGVTTLWLTAGLFAAFVDQRLDDLAGVRQLLAGGDVLSAAHVRAVLARHPGCTVINGYGPTENTTFTCCHPMQAGEDVPDAIPVGRPIANTTVYVLDDALQPVTAGEVGELFTGGDGVARGYLGLPQATAEKFLPDPFAALTGARMYRTGDLVRQRSDGVIEFVGRADTQVKILGHRIELGEIEVALLAQPLIAQACVLTRPTGAGHKRLQAFIVPKLGEPADHAGLSAPVLRAALASSLPGYMLPDDVTVIFEMPLTRNGKIDRARLPLIAAGSAQPAQSALACAPLNQIENQVSKAWHAVLGSARVNLDDNFFDVGGNSLRMMELHSKLEKEFSIRLPLVELFSRSTIRTQAQLIEAGPVAPPAVAPMANSSRQQAAFAKFRERRDKP